MYAKPDHGGSAPLGLGMEMPHHQPPDSATVRAGPNRNTK